MLREFLGPRKTPPEATKGSGIELDFSEMAKEFWGASAMSDPLSSCYILRSGGVSEILLKSNTGARTRNRLQAGFAFCKNSEEFSRYVSKRS